MTKTNKQQIRMMMHCLMTAERTVKEADTEINTAELTIKAKEMVVKEAERTVKADTKVNTVELTIKATEMVVKEAEDSQQARKETEGSNNADWKTEADIKTAVDMYRHQLLHDAEMEQDLVIKLDMGQSPEDRERVILQFYKQPNVNWARPVRVVLIGDAAVGDGVKRFFFTQTMAKLQCGFELSIDGPGKTIFFTGESDHQVPSTSRALIDSGLFMVVGKMVGHSILHGGPGLCGVSRSLLHPLIGQEGEEYLSINDCPDMDVREIIEEMILERIIWPAASDSESDEEFDIGSKCSITGYLREYIQEATSNELCNLLKFWVGWAVLPQSLYVKVKSVSLPTAVTCFETLHLPGHYTSFDKFKRDLQASMILERIIWPAASDSESDEEFDIGSKCSITGYLREYIQEATSNELCNLLKFWVGWAVLPQSLYVKVKSVSLPTAVTCFETLHLPGHYTSFDKFKRDLQASVSTTDSGFGLV
ncbi:hypothetical protein CRUP_008542 [Coryphaenoides rupestris]|nr:hypothetical protein CRUP_008542 [Coryphaenoides rupestris]